MLRRVLVVLAILAVLLAAGYFVGGVADVQFHGQTPSFTEVVHGVDFGSSFDSSIAGLKHRAIFVSIADDAFSFQVSWLGLILAVAFLLLLRLFRR